MKLRGWALARSQCPIDEQQAVSPVQVVPLAAFWNSRELATRKWQYFEVFSVFLEVCFFFLLTLLFVSCLFCLGSFIVRINNKTLNKAV